jgi:hypothetical protein
MISTLVFGKIIPSTVLAVDGSARTLTCVDVIPSTGATVGEGGGGSKVSVGGEGRVGDRVALESNGVRDAVTIWLVFVVQLLINNAMTMIPGEKYLKATG